MSAAVKTFVIQNDLRQLETFMDELLQFCANNGIAETVFFDIRLAMEEAVSNTIRHGYEDQKSHDIRIIAEIKNEDLHLVLEDDAKPFNPLDAADPNLNLPVEQRKIGGLGIYLLKMYMDEVSYQRIDGKNILRLRKAAKTPN